MFERAKPRGQISARELRRAGQLIDQARPMAAEGSAVFPFADAGGAVWADAGGDSFLALVTHVVTGSPGDPIKYGFAEQWPDPATGGLDALPGGRASDGTANWALAVPASETFAVDDLVRVRRHPQNANLYTAEPFPLPSEASTADNGPDASGGPILIGKLDGALSYQGSATMSIWSWDGSAYADSNDNVTVYDWVLSSGQSITSGTQVIASYDARSERYFVTSAQCA